MTGRGATEIQRCVFGPITVCFDQRVLTPRPWTLLQSQWAADLAADVPAGPLLELCAGAGHIGLAAAVLSARDLVQVEVDETAAEYARRNAAGAGLARRVSVRQASIDSAVAAEERFPLILADPPYLPRSQLGRWPEDPRRAIDGGADGLDLVRACLRISAAHLLDGGALLLQVAGEMQVSAVAAWLEDHPALGLECRETRSHDRERAVMLVIRTQAPAFG